MMMITITMMMMMMLALDRLSIGGSAWSDTGGPSIELPVEATDVLGNLALAKRYRVCTFLTGPPRLPYQNEKEMQNILA